MKKFICLLMLLVIFLFNCMYVKADDTYFLMPSEEEKVLFNNIENYLNKNAKFVDGYSVNLMFVVNKDKSISEIQIQSMKTNSLQKMEKAYNNGVSTSEAASYVITHSYEDYLTELGIIKENEEVMEWATFSVIPKDLCQDGNSIINLYNTVKELEGQIECPKDENYYEIWCTYYNSELGWKVVEVHGENKSYKI